MDNQVQKKNLGTTLNHKNVCLNPIINEEVIHKNQDKRKAPKSPPRSPSQAKCVACKKFIADQILCALGKTYHTECFVCHQCNKSLEDLKFGVDKDGNILCPNDYIKAYSPVCTLCKQFICPTMETGETVRVVAMGKEFHVDCYKCQDCRTPLTDEAASKCYPLDGMLLCYFCHRNRKKPHKKVETSLDGHHFFNPNIIKSGNGCRFADENGNYLLGLAFV